MGEKVRLNIMIDKEIYKELLKHIYERKAIGEKTNISKTIEEAVKQYLSRGGRNE